jgi:hypothetical protein
MAEDRRSTGPLAAAVGAALLAVSIFQPWYALKLTANGIASAQSMLTNVAAQYGNAAFQTEARGVGGSFSALAGHQIATLSAHQTLKYLHVVLLILAAAAFAAALSRLAGASSQHVSDGQIALIGAIATACVLFRMADRPAPLESIFTLSLSWGIWLALGGSLAILIGGVWPGGQAPRTGELPTAQ